jgi:hypothetical protein
MNEKIRDQPFKTSANFHDFSPLPPYHRYSSKMVMKWIFDPPLRHADVLNGWSLSKIAFGFVASVAS